MQGAASASATQLAFKAFATRHEAVNRWFRSTEISYRLGRMLAQGQDSAFPVKALFAHDFRRSDVLKQYRGRFSESGRTPQASIADFLLDLRDAWGALLESVIVQEAGALEMFIREWALAAIQEALLASKSLPKDRKSELESVAHEIRIEPYRTVSLTRVARLFPTLQEALNSTTYLRSKRPFLSPATGDVTCRSVADLWREVRNLILHHDRLVHQKFYENYAGLWLALQKESRNRGAMLVPRACYVGHPLPLVARHAVFCLTSCYQAAVVLHIAAGGSGEA